MPEPLHSQLFDQGNWTDVEKWVWQKASNGEIADFIPKLSPLAQFRPVTMKTSKSILELSKPAQFRPLQPARASIQLN